MLSYKVPNNYKLVYSKEQIAEQVVRLGAEIAPWVLEKKEQTKQEVMCLCVLHGAMFFFADLMRAISVSVEPRFCVANSYDVEKNILYSDGVKIDLGNVNVNGRAVLLVDDLCESGNTIIALTKELKKQEAFEIKSAVLITKKVEAPLVVADWSAFNLGHNEWLVGYGLEDKNQFRNLPDVYSLGK